jgi:hypothetical protein
MDTTRAKRIAELEDLLVETERQLIDLHQGSAVVPPPPPPAPALAAGSGPSDLPPPPPSNRSRPKSRQSPPSLMADAETFLRYGGVLLVIASAIFFVSEAVTRGWIGPAAQLSLATIGSLGTIAASFRFFADRRPWRISTAVAGAAGLFVSGVVGYVGLEILSFEFAVGWFGLSIVVFLVLARLHDAQSLSVASVPAVVTGTLLLASSDNATTISLLGALYLAGVVINTHRRSWFVARMTGGVAGGVMTGAGVLAISDSVSNVEHVFVAAISILSVMVIVASQALDFRSLEDMKTVPSLAIVEARLAALAIPWVSTVIASVVAETQTLSFDPIWIVVSSATLFGLAALFLSSLANTMRVLHVASALVTTAVGLAVLVSGPVLLVVLLGQSLIAGWLAYRFRTPDMILVAALLSTIVFSMTAVLLERGALVEALTIAESLAVFAVVFGTAVVATAMRRENLWLHGWLLTFILGLGWTAATFRDVAQGQMIVSLLWATVGTGAMWLGSRIDDRDVIRAGLVTLAATAAKLIFIDLVAVDVLWRAALFFIVGSTFLRLGFLLPGMLTTASEPIDPEPVETKSADLRLG